ncbi:hypothetical protein HGRIS_001648 [Hohenbuehelia grisea]|uniref:Uncharacterized protein n=1 Tax=Hohenbuehelia grisea TaxID=104357 RepID=A0ABR3JIN0_9AGAR
MSKIHKISNTILQLDGVGKAWREADKLVERGARVERLILDIACAAMLGIDHLEAEYKRQGIDNAQPTAQVVGYEEIQPAQDAHEKKEGPPKYLLSTDQICFIKKHTNDYRSAIESDAVDQFFAAFWHLWFDAYPAADEEDADPDWTEFRASLAKTVSVSRAF